LNWKFLTPFCIWTWFCMAMNSLLVSFIYTGQCVCFFFCSFLFYFVALHDIFDQKGVWEGEGLTPSLPPHRTHNRQTYRCPPQETKFGIFWFLETFMVRPCLNNTSNVMERNICQEKSVRAVDLFLISLFFWFRSYFLLVLRY